MDTRPFQVRFLLPGGKTRAATKADEPYLRWLERAVREAAEDDPGEEGEIEGRSG